MIKFKDWLKTRLNEDGGLTAPTSPIAQKKVDPAFKMKVAAAQQAAQIDPKDLSRTDPDSKKKRAMQNSRITAQFGSDVAKAVLNPDGTA